MSENLFLEEESPFPEKNYQEDLRQALFSIEKLQAENQRLTLLLENYQGPDFETVEKVKQVTDVKYQAVIKNAPWGIIISKPGEFVLEVNDAVCEIFGYTSEEFKTKKRADLVVEDEAFISFLKLRNETGKAKAEVIGKRKNGSFFPLEFSSIVFRDPLSGELHNSSIALDLTERKKADQERKLMLESILDYFYVLDYDFTFKYLNPAADQLFSNDHGNLLGEKIFDVFPILKEGIFYQNALKCIETKKPIQFEYFSETLQYWFEESFYPTEDGLSIFFRSIEERKKSEQELIRQKELSDTILFNIPIMISFIETNGKFSYVNASWEKELGYSKAETMASNDFIDLILLDKSKKEEVISNILNADGNWIDYELLTRAGKTIQSIWTNVKLSDGRIIGIGQNITERKQNEDKIRISNERYEYVTKATFDAIWDSDLLSGIVYWGDGFKTLFGYEPDRTAMTHLEFEDFLHPSDKKRVNRGFLDAIASEKNVWHDEYLFKKANGEYAFVQDRALIIRDENKKAIRAVGAMHDISQQKEEEDRLKLLELAITSSTDGILILEINHKNLLKPKIVYANQAFTRMTGYPLREILGKTKQIFQGQNSDENQLGRINQALLNFKPVEVELINYKKDGSTFWVLVSSVPFANKQGDFTHWISIQRDTTERKKRELEREDLVNNLTRSNNELKQFSYITSHNMRSPLANMISISELIDTSKIPDPFAVEMIGNFKISARNLNETLEDLIQILIVKEKGKQEIERVKFDEVYQNVAFSIKSLIVDSSALIQTNFSGAEWVMFNKAYLESIFLNLITNSIKYSGKNKKPIIFIYTILNPETIQLVVEDNGLGFNMEKAQDKIFGLYQKFHNHADSKGIGLYLIHSQITSMGGNIEVESEENQGTKFTITFKNEKSETL